MVVEMTKCPECGYEGKKKNGYPYKSKANYSHDRKYYHNPHDGTSTIQHPCILPPPEAQYQAQLVKQAYKDWAIGKSIKENVML